MILSAEQLLSDDQAVTATAISENVIDLGVAGTPYDAAAAFEQDIGKGNKIPILIQVTEDFATLTTLTITVEVSENSDMSSPKTLATEAISAAALVQGKQTRMQVIPDDADRRYLGLRYTVAGSDATAGKITAGITMGNQTNVTGV